MPFDFKKLAADIGFSEEDKQTLYGLFEKNPDVVGKFETVLSAEVNARVSPAAAELEAKRAELDAQFDTLASIRGGDATAIAAAERRAETLASQHAILESRFRAVATQNGLDPDELLKDIAPTPKAAEKPVSQSFDPDALLRQANLGSLNAFEQSLLVEDLVTQHKALFGTDMNRTEMWSKFRDTVKRTGNTELRLNDFYETHYNVKAKRDELAEAAVQQRIKTALDADRVARADEAALRTTNQPPASFRPESPVFAAVKGAQPAAVGGIPDAVVAAMKSWTTAKHAS